MHAMALNPSPMSSATLAIWLGSLYADLNWFYPFRDGNGRTQRERLRQWAERFSYVLYYAALEPATYLSAATEPDSADQTTLL